MSNAINNGFPERGGTRWFSSALLGTAVYFASQYVGPLRLWGGVDLVSGLATFLFTDAAFSLAAVCFWSLGNHYNRKAVETPTGAKGQAAFIEDLTEIEHEFEGPGVNVYCGADDDGLPVIPKVESNMTIMGPSGSGKTAGPIMTNIWFIKTSKIILDFKGELYHVMAPALRKRGEKVHVFNIGDKDLGPNAQSGSYNLLTKITQNFTREGGLLDVSDDVFDFIKQLLPEPENGNGENTYFRDGSRDLISFSIQVTILVYGPEANLGHVAALLNDREALMNNALWACGKLPVHFYISKATHETWSTEN